MCALDTKYSLDSYISIIAFNFQLSLHLTIIFKIVFKMSVKMNKKLFFVNLKQRFDHYFPPNYKSKLKKLSRYVRK